MKSATKADKIRLSWHLKRFKNLIGVLHKIFILKFSVSAYALLTTDDIIGK